MDRFQLNFNSSEKVVSITLTEPDGVFQLARLFKTLLDQADIPNTYEETPVTNAEQNSENIGD
jgi:hypothetical protein